MSFLDYLYLLGVAVFEYKGIYGSVEWSQEDGCFYGNILNISGLITYEARNIYDLEKEFRLAVDDYLSE